MNFSKIAISMFLTFSIFAMQSPLYAASGSNQLNYDTMNPISSNGIKDKQKNPIDSTFTDYNTIYPTKKPGDYDSKPKNPTPKVSVTKTPTPTKKVQVTSTNTPSPTVTVTKTPTPTVKPTMTPTQYVEQSAIKVETYNAITVDSINNIAPFFKVTNLSKSAIDLSKVKIRYYYTINGEKPQNFWCDHAAIVGPGYSTLQGVYGKFTKLNEKTNNEDYYLEIGFTNGVVEPKSYAIMYTRFNKLDWTNYKQSDDYSFNPVKDFSMTNKVTAYIDGKLVWGNEFGKPHEPTITPTPTATLTPTTTLTPTSTPTPTPTKVKNYVTSEGILLDEFDAMSTSYMVYHSKIELDSNSVSGKGSLKISSEIAGSQDITFENHSNCNYDLSGMDNVEFNFYIPDKTKFTALSVAFFTDDLWHSGLYINYIGSYEFQNGWNKIVRRKSDFISSNGGDWSKIKCFRVTVYANEGCNPSINIDRMAYNVNGNSKILFTFDDAWTNVYDNAYSIMQAKGFKATTWAVKELSTNGDPDFMSVEQLNTLYNNGWDIGNHTENHVDNITVLSPDEKKSQYLECQNWLLSNNWTRGAYHVCYPSGSLDDELVSILKSIGVKTGRTTVYGVQPVPVEDIYRLKTIPVGKDVSMDLIKSEIDKAVATGQSVMFMLHRVEDNPTLSFSISTTSFKELVEYVDTYVKAGKTEVQTISQWYDGYVNGK